MKYINSLTVLASYMALASCATVVRGTEEDVKIVTTPADALVVTSLNHTCNSNPCIVKVARKEPFVVTASKPGYQTQSVSVETKVSGKGAAGVAGNVLVGGLVGVGVDAATGAGLDHTPNPVVINLVPNGAAGQAISPEPAREPRRRRGSPTS